MVNYSLYIILMLLFATQEVYANSFVGNGGSAGDVELLITKKQIKESFDKVNQTSESNTDCECLPYFNNRNECAPLNQLNSEQKKYCSEQLKIISGSVISLITDNNLIFNWTDKNIFVDDNGQSVAADAVANSNLDSENEDKQKTITINKKTFLSSSQAQRVFLITHELLHLVKFEEKYLSDSGTVGPFLGKQGQREFINTLAAETVMQTYRHGLNYKYQEALTRVQNYKKNWLDFDIILATSLDSNNNTYDLSAHKGVQLNYKRYFNQFGLNLGFKSLLGTKELLTSIEVEEQLSVLSLGVAYRFFLSEDTLTAFGQSFINLDINVDFVSSKFDISDPFISSSSSDSAAGLSANIKYYYPISFMWLTVGMGFSHTNYNHEIVNLEKNAINLSGNVGVSYGF